MFCDDEFSDDYSFFGSDDGDYFCCTEDDDKFDPDIDEQRSDSEIFELTIGKK